MVKQAQSVTRQQIEALRKFADSNGRTWKSKLGDVWCTGAYRSGDDIPQLQTIRNTLGPTWLRKFHFPEQRVRIVWNGTGGELDSAPAIDDGSESITDALIELIRGKIVSPGDSFQIIGEK